jgi:hypothetical protein
MRVWILSAFFLAAKLAMPRGKGTLEVRRPDMKETTRKKIPFPGVKEIKQVELYTKWRNYVPEEYKEKMCPEVAPVVIKKQRLEKSERQAKRQKTKPPDAIVKKAEELKKDLEIDSS